VDFSIRWKLKNAFFNIERVGAPSVGVTTNLNQVTASPAARCTGGPCRPIAAIAELGGSIRPARCALRCWPASPSGSPAPKSALPYPADIARQSAAREPARARLEITEGPNAGEIPECSFREGLAVTGFGPARDSEGRLFAGAVAMESSRFCWGVGLPAPFGGRAFSPARSFQPPAAPRSSKSDRQSGAESPARAKKARPSLSSTFGGLAGP